MLLLTFLFFGSEVQIQLNCNRRPRAVPYTIRVPWVLNSQTAVWVKASGIFSQNHKSTHLFKSLQIFSLCLSVYMSVCISSVQSLSRVRLFATLWIAARQASLSITNSRSSYTYIYIYTYKIAMKSFCFYLYNLNLPSIYCVLLLLLLLSRFSCVWLCATPETAAHQAPPSLGFSRQEHWSGLPFPSPMQESEKWKWSRSVVSDS